MPDGDCAIHALLQFIDYSAEPPNAQPLLESVLQAYRGVAVGNGLRYQTLQNLCGSFGIPLYHESDYKGQPACIVVRPLGAGLHAWVAPPKQRHRVLTLTTFAQALRRCADPKPPQFPPHANRPSDEDAWLRFLA